MSPLRAALFDMDGTIFDSRIDLGAVRSSLGLERDGRPFLEQLSCLPRAEQERGMALLVEAETRGAAEGTLLPGAEDLLSFFHQHGVLCALVTNNSRASTDVVLARHPLPFDLVLTRDEGAAKPHPGAFLDALERLGAAPRETVAIGDAHLDLLAAHRAGIAEIVLVAPPPWVLDFVPQNVSHRRAANLGEVLELLRALVA